MQTLSEVTMRTCSRFSLLAKSVHRHGPLAGGGVTALLLVAASGLAACAEPAAEDTLPVALAGATGAAATDSARVPVTAVEHARATADTLATRLMTRLREEMQEGGPAAAVHACADVAPTFTAELQRPDRTIRRVSLHWRTPRDTPDPFERDILEAMGADVGAGLEPAEVMRVEEGADGRWLRLMRPIRAVPMCLQCHGSEEELAPEVRAFLAERYPDDRATGHAEGDLRGAFSVRIRLADSR